MLCSLRTMRSNTWTDIAKSTTSDRRLPGVPGVPAVPRDPAERGDSASFRLRVKRDPVIGEIRDGK